MNLLLVAHDFPFGTAETFLETEIQYASKAFKNVYVISASQSNELTRRLPHNVHAVKANRHYHSFRCIAYALAHVLNISNLLNTIKNAQQTHYSFLKALKKQFIYFAIEKRLKDKCKEEGLFGSDFIAYSYWLAEGAFFLARNKRKWKRTVSRAHSYEVWPSTYNPYIDFTVNELDAIYCISEQTCNLVSDKCKSLSKEKLNISRLGIESNSTRNENIEKNDRYIIVSCSSIYSLKRLDLIIDSLSKVKFPIEWRHFGGGIDEEKIKEYGREAFFGRNILWSISGWVSNETVINFYRNNHVDLFINLSDNEGVPVSIMEAISFGIPCIARDVGGIREIVNESTGILLSNDTNEITVANAIESILQQPISKCKIVEYFESRYSAVTNYECFYNMLLKN